MPRRVQYSMNAKSVLPEAGSIKLHQNKAATLRKWVKVFESGAAIALKNEKKNWRIVALLNASKLQAEVALKRKQLERAQKLAFLKRKLETERREWYNSMWKKYIDNDSLFIAVDNVVTFES